jgi:hypothetical protein
MLLAAAILGSIGSLFILGGAWVQARAAYQEHVKHYRYPDLNVSVGPEGFLVLDPPGVSGQFRIRQCVGHIDDAPLSFLPTLGTMHRREATFAGWYGWLLVVLGGFLVLVGSVIAAIGA